MNLFRIRGIPLAVHFSFFLWLLVIAFSAWVEYGWAGVTWYTAVVLAFFACVVLHELGHSLTAMRFGIGVRRILLMPIGGMAAFEDIPRQPGRELLIAIAGPLVNFALAAVLWFLLRDQTWSKDDPFTLVGFGAALLKLNIVMGVFNLLPAFPMDGGRILRALLATRLRYLRATFWAATVGKVVALAGLAWAILIQDEPLLAVLFAFIFVLGELEYRAAKRREREDEHWRTVLARFHPPPAPEPPVVLR